MNRHPMNLLRIGQAAMLTVAVFAALGISAACAADHETPKNEPAEPAAPAAATETAAASAIRGIELGEYRIRSDYPAEAQKSTVKFVLYAAVKGDRATEMERLVEEHKQKIRDEIITTTRLAPLAAFEEPDLATFRRRILIRLRRVMPELVVEDLFISDFSLLVKSL